MRIFKALVRIVIGVIFGIAIAFALVPAFAAFTNGAGEQSATIMWIVVVLIAAMLTFFAPTIRRAFGRGFLILGAAVFALPLSVMLLSGRVTHDMVSVASADVQAMVAVGSGVVGALMTGASAFIGFFFGTILLIVGLVLSLGGRREVIVVQSGAQLRSDPTL